MRAFLLAVVLTAACGGKTFDGTPDPDAATDSASTSDTALATDGGTADLTRCTGPNTCSLLPKSCCGGCGPLTTDTMTAVTRGMESKYTSSVCGPTPVGCPECAPAIYDGSIQAWCVGSRCAAVDVRKESVSVCASDADCTLRHSPCCEPCDDDPFDLIALNRTQISAYRAQVCVGDETCSKCLSRYPADTTAVCDPATKHCRVKSPMLP